MSLISKLFSSPPDFKLEQCRVNNAGHIALYANNKGAHVGKLQQALLMIAVTDHALASATSSQGFTNEYAAQTYGQATAAAVLKYKQDRKIINPLYQTTADNVVGKMTIVSLDQTVAVIENIGAKRVRLLPYFGLHTFESQDPRAFAAPSLIFSDVSPQRAGDGAAPPAATGTQWSVASISFMHSVAKVGQIGFVLYRFRDDQTKETADFISPQFGAGIGIFDVIEFLNWMKKGKKIGIEAIKGLEDMTEKMFKAALRGGNLKDTIIDILKEIATGVSSFNPWSPYSQAEVFMPVWFRRLNEKTIGGGGASAGYSVGTLYVYGMVWHTQDNGKKMHSTRDLMRIDTHAWFDGIQLPGASFTGGPLLAMRELPRRR